jgi:type I restriction enzyme S subunit
MTNPVAAGNMNAGTVLHTTVGAMCDRFGGAVQTGPFGSQLHSSDYSDEGIPVVMPQDMVDGQISCDKIARVPDAHVRRLDRHQLQIGDIVFSRRGDVGRFAVVSPSEQGWLCGTGSIRIRLNCPDIDVGYLRRFLQQEAIGNWLLHNAKGVTMPNLNTEIIRSLPFVYRPLDDQRRIATILDHADDLRRKRREAIKRLNRLKRSMLNQLLGEAGTATTITCLSELVDEFRYGTSEKATGAGHPVLRIPNVIGDRITVDDLKYVTLGAAELERLRLREGDLLFVRTNGNPAYVGRSAVVKASLGGEIGFSSEDFVYASYLIRARLKPDLADPTYLQTYLGGPAGRKAALERAKTSAGQFNINIEGLGAIPVELPPIGLQRRFSAQARTVDMLLSAHDMHFAKLDALFSSLQYRAFRGEL